MPAARPSILRFFGRAPLLVKAPVFLSKALKKDSAEESLLHEDIMRMPCTVVHTIRSSTLPASSARCVSDSHTVGNFVTVGYFHFRFFKLQINKIEN